MNPLPDVVVVGGGIVGLATALSLVDRGARVTILEKESSVGKHQTGHNSNVIHTGIYYRPGSLKARLCVEGREKLIEFCYLEDIPVTLSGKVVIATSENELPALEELHRRGLANGVENVSRVGTDGIRALEPFASGIDGLSVPGAGVVNFSQVANAMRRRLEAQKGVVSTGTRVTGASRRNGAWTVKIAGSGKLQTPEVVICAGLHADRVANAFGLKPTVRIVPFRGEYWHLRRPDLVRSLIYPVPDPRFPFLGVHFTKTSLDTVEVGPNAVLALAREGYSWGKISLHDIGEIATTPGLRRLVRNYWRTGSRELFHSLIPRLLVKTARSMLPSLKREDLIRGGSGVRAQALAPDGKLVDDFAFAEGEGVLAVLNAPSPAATASIAIGEAIAARVGL